MGNYKMCVPQTCCFLFFSMCVCDWGPLKVYSSVLLMCFMSQGRALAWPMDSLPLSVWCGLITGRGRGYGKTPFIPQSIHFDLTRWCNADQQTGENVKVTVCVAVCMWGGTYVCVRVYVCAYVLVWVINASIIHCFKHVLRTSLRFLWRQVMFLMLLLWRVYMYICVVNKYFLFK